MPKKKEFGALKSQSDISIKTETKNEETLKKSKAKKGHPHKRHSYKDFLKEKCFYDPNVEYEVYTDAAFTKRHTAPGVDKVGQGASRPVKYAGLGVFWGTAHVNNISYPITLHDQWLEKGPMTSDTAELMAVQIALVQAAAQNIRYLKVYTDSMLVICALVPTLSEGIKATFKHLKYSGCPFTRRIKYWMKKFDSVRFQKVKAHSGDPGNEAADQLAKAALDPARIKYEKELAYYQVNTPKKVEMHHTMKRQLSKAQNLKRRSIHTLNNPKLQVHSHKEQTSSLHTGDKEKSRKRMAPPLLPKSLHERPKKQFKMNCHSKENYTPQLDHFHKGNYPSSHILPRATHYSFGNNANSLHNRQQHQFGLNRHRYNGPYSQPFTGNYQHRQFGTYRYPFIRPKYQPFTGNYQYH